MQKTLAVVTGASSGLGLVFARQLAPKYDLLLVARRQQRLDELAAELAAKHGCTVNVLAADLADQSQLAAVAARIAAEPHLALLVNNAGFGSRGFFWESDRETQERMHNLHVAATVRLCHTALNTMVAKKSGAIVNVASVAAFWQRGGSVSYGATKRWMTAFTEGLYLELKSIQSPVKVQALCPGYTFTEFHDALHLDRNSIAPAAMWLRPEFVVAESLNALARGNLLVVPGWRYKALVALVSVLPNRLRVALEAAGANKAFDWK